MEKQNFTPSLSHDEIYIACMSLFLFLAGFFIEKITRCITFSFIYLLLSNKEDSFPKNNLFSSLTFIKKKLSGRDRLIFYDV